MNRFIKRCTSALSVSAVSVMLTAGIAGASAPSHPEPGPKGPRPAHTQAVIHQTAVNHNATDQSSEAKAESRQKNVNTPFSVLTIWTGNGDVDQSNQAHNTAVSGNDNATWQGIDQHAKQQVDGTSNHPKPHPKPDPEPHSSGNDCGCSPAPLLQPGNGNEGQGGPRPDGAVIDQDAKNYNDTTQRSTADASSEQKNVNLPVSIVSFGSNNGDVDQSNKAHNIAVSGNDNATWQGIDQHAKQQVDGPKEHDTKWSGGKDSGGKECGCSNKPGKPGKGPHDDGATGSIDQDAKNKNSTEQDSAAHAASEQKNLSLPVAILSVGSNNGDVDQSNKASNVALSGNDNATWQGIDQYAKQEVDGSGKPDGGKHDDAATIDQDAFNGNETTQDSSADASSKQANVNVPISVLSAHSNNGDVEQSNKANDVAVSGNSNGTEQGIEQGARQKSDGGDAKVEQDADNKNSTEQTSSASASGNQVNINAPISILSIGSNNGDVDQSNHANNGAGSFNSNGTGQWAGQTADQSAG